MNKFKLIGLSILTITTFSMGVNLDKGFRILENNKYPLNMKNSFDKKNYCTAKLSITKNNEITSNDFFISEIKKVFNEINKKDKLMKKYSNFNNKKEESLNKIKFIEKCYMFSRNNKDLEKCDDIIKNISNLRDNK